MQNSLIIKSGICLLLMGLATVDVAQAGFGARFAQVMNARRALGLALVTTSVAKVAGTAGASEKETQFQKQKGGFRSVEISHPLVLQGESSASAEQPYEKFAFWSIVRPNIVRPVGTALTLNDAQFFPAADAIEKSGWLSWLANKKIPYASAANGEVYSAIVPLRTGTVTTNFSSVKDLTSNLMLTTPSQGRQRLVYIVKDGAGNDLFSHTLLSRTGGTRWDKEHFAATFREQNEKGLIVEHVIDVTLPSKRSCEERYKNSKNCAYQHFLDNVEQCRRTPIRGEFPPKVVR